MYIVYRETSRDSILLDKFLAPEIKYTSNLKGPMVNNYILIIVKIMYFLNYQSFVCFVYSKKLSKGKISYSNSKIRSHKNF